MNRFTFGQNSLQKDAGPCNKLQRFRLSNFDNIKRFLKHKVSQSKDWVDSVWVWVLVDEPLEPVGEIESHGVTVRVRIVSKEDFLARWKLCLPVTHGLGVDCEALYVAKVGLQLQKLKSWNKKYIFAKLNVRYLWLVYFLGSWRHRVEYGLTPLLCGWIIVTQRPDIIQPELVLHASIVMSR